MKIMSKKSYEKLQQCLTELQMDYTDAKEQLKIYDKQVNYLVEQNNGITSALAKAECDIDDYKKEIKKLKTLLTKNKIKYKKEK